jgi:hypothetical protein
MMYRIKIQEGTKPETEVNQIFESDRQAKDYLRSLLDFSPLVGNDSVKNRWLDDALRNIEEKQTLTLEGKVYRLVPDL